MIKNLNTVEKHICDYIILFMCELLAIYIKS
jgi:hypothetical protein